MIQMNAGTDSVKSSRSMSLIGDIMNKPTNTRIGQVAALGMERKSGAKSKAIPKQIAVTKEVIPERLLERCLMRSLQMCLPYWFLTLPLR